MVVTQYLNSRFSVYAPGTDTYRENYDRIFSGVDATGPDPLRKYQKNDVIWQLAYRLHHRMYLCSKSHQVGVACQTCVADEPIFKQALWPDGENVAIHYIPMKVHVDICNRCGKSNCCVSECA